VFEVLNDLLNLLAVGGIHSISELAHELRVNETLVEEMLAGLTQRGYLRPVDAACQSHCSTCPLANACAAGRIARTWALTQKGARLIKDDIVQA
jgi:predicted ArsR family transcriptional regulator